MLKIKIKTEMSYVGGWLNCILKGLFKGVLTVLLTRCHFHGVRMYMGLKYSLKQEGNRH